MRPIEASGDEFEVCLNICGWSKRFASLVSAGHLHDQAESLLTPSRKVLGHGRAPEGRGFVPGPEVRQGAVGHKGGALVTKVKSAPFAAALSAPPLALRALLQDRGEEKGRHHEAGPDLEKGSHPRPEPGQRAAHASPGRGRPCPFLPRRAEIQAPAGEGPLHRQKQAQECQRQAHRRRRAMGQPALGPPACFLGAFLGAVRLGALAVGLSAGGHVRGERGEHSGDGCEPDGPQPPVQDEAGESPLPQCAAHPGLATRGRLESKCQRDGGGAQLSQMVAQRVPRGALRSLAAAKWVAKEAGTQDGLSVPVL
mmetsp:Transcript_47723/g.108300  ORF Transcript_47723/g.108300 Transcript_47723/m.108300 type:complete len:311 (-) Transcript_47723:578-1510(-)